MKKIIVIPARLSSSRLPEKPLINLLGKSMIQRTYEKCLQVKNADDVYVATDSEKILSHCNALGIRAILTSDQCLTGTDRVHDFSKKIEADYYINVQGDEPLINPLDIEKIIENTQKFKGEVLNGYTSISNQEDYHSVTIPKVVMRPDGRLLYMSRSAIPGNKKNEFIKSWRQVCIYAFTNEMLSAFSACEAKTPLEELEDIEIIRFLELGYDVRMIELSGTSIAVDVPTDVERVVSILKQEYAQ